jgi:hypothetical protein
LTTALWLAGFAGASATPVGATVIVTLVPSAIQLDVGQTFTVDIFADASAPLVGFGIDLVLDPIVGPGPGLPVIGSAWIPVAGLDGDGLTGIGPITGLIGSILLATVTVEALAPGVANLDITVTPGDLTEGFPLLAGGFDVFQTATASVLVTPEPSTSMLLSFGILVLLCARRSGSHGRLSEFTLRRRGRPFSGQDTIHQPALPGPPPGSGVTLQLSQALAIPGVQPFREGADFGDEAALLASDAKRARPLFVSTALISSGHPETAELSVKLRL